MLKRLSSLTLVLLLAGSVIAGTTPVRNEHVCRMICMEMMPGMQLSASAMPDTPTCEVYDMEMSHMEMSHMEMSHMEMSHMEMSHMEMSHMEMSHMEMSHMEMSDIEITCGRDIPGMDALSRCEKDHAEASIALGSMGECCFTIPQEPGQTGTIFNPRSPSFSVAITHPAVTQPPVFVPKRDTRPYATQFFLPNLQATYIRNLSFLI